MNPLVKAPPFHVLVYKDPVGTGDAVSEHLDDVGVTESAESFHLGAEFTEALKGVWVELLDGDGDAVGELGAVDEAEAAVADDEVGGEVVCGDRKLCHGDLVEGRVKGGAL